MNVKCSLITGSKDGKWFGTFCMEEDGVVLPPIYSDAMDSEEEVEEWAYSVKDFLESQNAD